MDPRSLPTPPEWQDPIREYLSYCRSSGRRAETIRTYNERLATLSRALKTPPGEVTYDQILQHLGNRSWSPATRYSRLQTWRGFWEWLVRTGRATTNPTHGVPHIKLPPPSPRPLPYRLYLDALVRADPRTRLILRLAGELGMRRSEIAVVMPPRDLTETDNGWKLCIHGKGGKTRYLPLTDEIAYYLTRIDGYAFPGRIDGHLSPRRIAEVANLTLPGNWTLHKLRHMFASRSYAISRDLAAVQTLLGHSSPATTKAYVEVSDQQLRGIVEAVSTRSLDNETNTKLMKREDELLTIDLAKSTPEELNRIIGMLAMHIHTRKQ